MGAEGHDVVSYYAHHFREGMVDLSASNAPTALLGFQVPADPAGYARADTEALRSAIAGRYLHVQPSDIVLGSGASEVLAALAHALVRNGSRVACDDGAYPSFTAAVARCGAERVRFTPGTRAQVIALCNPTVPHGDILELEAVCAEARASGAILLVDEVYRELVDGDRPQAVCDLDPRAVSIGDLSKPLGLGGLRVGWAVVRDAELRARVSREIALLSGGLSVLSVRAALPVLRDFDRRVERTMSALRENRAGVASVLTDAGWRFRLPRAGLTMLGAPPVRVEERDLEALRASGVFLLPGSAVGAPGGIRISLLADPAELARAIRQLSGAPGRSAEILILTKTPLRGLGKSRLAASVGVDGGVALARAFLADTIALARRTAIPNRVVYTPGGSESTLRELAGETAMELQADGDLGDRIFAALKNSLARSRLPILIGSDTPDLPARMLDDASRELERADVVLGPASDGGFYLIAAQRVDRRLFDGVDWSTGQVFAQTATNARRLGLSIAVLPEWADIDDISGLAELASRLSAGTEPCVATRSALRALGLEGWDG